MQLIKIAREKEGKSKFLHLLDLKNMKVIFSKDDKGVRVEACETKDTPPYVASLKFSFYITNKEYAKIAKKHKGIVQRMMKDLENLSSTINEMYRKKEGGVQNFGKKGG